MSYAIKTIGRPVEESIRGLQSERRQTLIYLADPRAADSLTELRSRRADTDRALNRVKRNAASGVRDRMDDITSDRLSHLLDTLDGLALMRRSVDESTITREGAMEFYNRLVDPSHNVLASLYGDEDVDGDNWGRALIGLDRAKEMLSREDALVASALMARRMTAEDVRGTSDLVANRVLLYESNLADLPLSDRATLEQYWRTPATLELRQAEDRLIAAGPADKPKTVSAETWQDMTASVLGDLTNESEEAAALYQQHIEPVRQGVFLRVGFSAVLGLLALLVSVIVSVRVGRDLIRDLSQLRKEAHEVSGVRLPSVMQPARHAANRSTWRPRRPGSTTRRTRSARSARPSTPFSARPSRPPSNRPICGAASPRCSSTSPAATRSCSTVSSRSSTPWSAARRTPRNSPTCSASTT